MAVKSVADVIGSAVASFDARIADTKRDRALLKSAKMQKRLTQLITPLLYILGDLANARIEIFCGKPVVFISMFSIDSFKQTELVNALGLSD